MLATEIRQCINCKSYLEIHNFYFRKGSNTYRKRCKLCFKQQVAENYKNNSNYYIEKTKLYRDTELKGTLKGWLTYVLKGSKRRAKEKGLEHNLTKEWLLENLPEKCPVFNIELVFGGERYNSPSLDRVDNHKGYTIDNVRIISNKANTLKSNATIEELEAIVRYMKNE